MINKKMFFFIFIVLFLNCKKMSLEQDKNMEVKKYYETFSGYSHPVNLIGELALEEIKKKEGSYYVGYYKKKLLIRVDKILNKKMAFSYIYSYDSSDNLVKVILKRDNKQKVIPIQKDND